MQVSGGRAAENNEGAKRMNGTIALANHNGPIDGQNTATGETYVIRIDPATLKINGVCGPLAERDYKDENGDIRDDWAYIGWNFEDGEDAEWAEAQNWVIVAES
jgi:hypothetical protein